MLMKRGDSPESFSFLFLFSLFLNKQLVINDLFVILNRFFVQSRSSNLQIQMYADNVSLPNSL